MKLGKGVNELSKLFTVNSLGFERKTPPLSVCTRNHFASSSLNRTRVRYEFRAVGGRWSRMRCRLTSEKLKIEVSYLFEHLRQFLSRIAPTRKCLYQTEYQLAPGLVEPTNPCLALETYIFIIRKTFDR